jgi:O-antigen/teichoic acid export membrane protein
MHFSAEAGDYPAAVTTAAESAARRRAGARVGRNTLAQWAGDVSVKIGLLVLYAIIGRSLGKAGFGDYTLAVSLAFLVRLAGLGTDVILTREVARGVERVHGLFWHTIVLKLGTGLVLLAGIVGFAVLGDYSESVVLLVLLIGLSNLIDSFSLSYHAVLKGREKMVPTSKALALETLTIACLGAVVLVALDAGLVALGAVYVIAAVVAFAYIWTAVRRHGVRPRRKGGSGLRSLARVAVPTGIATFFGAGLARLDAIILSVITGDSAVVGLYGGAYRIFEATLFVSWSLGFAVYPLLSRGKRRSEPLRRVFELSTMAIAAMTFAIAGAMAFYGTEIVTAVFGPEFDGAGDAVRILSGAAAAAGIYNLALLTIAAKDRQGVFPWIGGIALALNVALNVILIPPYGLNGAAVAMLAAQVLAAGMAFWFAVRETGRVSVARMFASPLAALAAMALPPILFGFDAVVLPLSVAAYVAVFFAAEWLFWREDTRSFVQLVRERGRAADDSAREGEEELAIWTGTG